MSDGGSESNVKESWCPAVLPSCESWPRMHRVGRSQLLPFTLPVVLQWQQSEVINLKCFGEEKGDTGLRIQFSS